MADAERGCDTEDARGAGAVSLLQPGETCWRVETAHRVAFLVDAQAYYAALSEALGRARRSVWILGWAFDPRTRLAPDGREGPDDPDEIGQILIRLASSNPGLDVRVLVWKSALSINGSRTFFEHRARKTFRGTRVLYREDGATPFGACHHQKVVVIDGEVAFCGGADIAVNRWDTLAHLHRDPRRILPHRAPHAARHDIMMLVDGPAALALADLFRERWTRSGGGDLVVSAGCGSWPQIQAPQLRETPIGIVRTLPCFRERPVVNEGLRLHLACIEAARNVIYLENQYFTSRLITDALARRLAEPNGPEVVMVLASRAPSWFDGLTMDPGRRPLLRQLHDADTYGRFRAFSPHTTAGAPIVVHAKVSVFDNRVARVGSANLNNRAEGFDTECDLAVEADETATRREVARFRDGLLAHWVGVTEAEFAETRARYGRLIPAIEALNNAGRLIQLPSAREGWWDRFVSQQRLGDPADPGESWRLWKRPRRGLLTLPPAERGAQHV